MNGKRVIVTAAAALAAVAIALGLWLLWESRADITGQTVLLRFQDIAKAGSDLVSTDVPKGLLAKLAGIAEKSQQLGMTSIELVPPLVDPDYPDYAAIQQLIHDSLHPVVPEEEGGEG